MKVEIDKTKCVGHTMCNLTSPDVYKLDDDGYSYVESATVPQGLEAKARAGARACPELAITLIEEQ